MNINYHGKCLVIDETATLSQMREACPLFFKNSRKGEKKTVYRGCLIVENRVDFTNAPNTRTVHVCAFDTLDNGMNSIISSHEISKLSIKEIKSSIDNFLKEHSENPPNIIIEEVEVTIKVKVKTRVHLTKNKASAAEVIELLAVEGMDPRHLDKDKPGDTVYSRIFSLAVEDSFRRHTNV